MRYIGNAFSLQMVAPGSTIYTKEITLDAARAFARVAASVVGHADTANVVSAMLGVEIPTNRQSIKLCPGDRLVVAQITGGRLPEGATTLPENCKIVFLQVDVEGPRQLWEKSYGKNSIYVAVRARAEKIASGLEDGNVTVTDLQDGAGNFMCEISGCGFSGHVWDD